MFSKLILHPPLSASRLISQRSLGAISTRANLNQARFLSTTPRPQSQETIAEDSKRSFQLHPADHGPIGFFITPYIIKRELTTLALGPSEVLTPGPGIRHSELNAIKVVRHERKTMSDKVASFIVSASRRGFDFVTGYKHSSPEDARRVMEKEGLTDLPLAELRRRGFVMDVPQWMIRILFLETIAGVPGMVAGMCRHLQSLRLMKRDGGWIATLLQEAENERMHLLTFMKISDPGWFFRLVIVGAQGVYCNLFFLAYLISPNTAHRFVGYLEEEAVVTYTQIVDEMERGNLPEWEKGGQQVPQIAKDYWRLADDATMLDLVKAVRADEAGHRFVNHTLANLDTKNDFNPFGLRHPDSTMQGTLPGITRDESLKWIQDVEDEFRRGRPDTIALPENLGQKQQEVEHRREGEMA
ncbi:ubiquinol oxidase, partial [Phenoliferia sp. Uapishka_3]